MNLLYFISYLLRGGVRKIQHALADWACKNDVVFDKGVRFTLTAKVENISKNIHNINIGKNSIIEGRLCVFKYGGRISIGENTYIGAGTNIWSGEFLEIGNHVLISHNVNIIDTNSHELNYIERAARYEALIKYGHPKDKASIITGNIIIEDYAWINFGVTILKNVRIGKGAIVAASSVVTKDVPPFTVVAGNPARIVKYLNK